MTQTALTVLDALPRWLRWVLFFPVGAACSLVVVTFVEVACELVGLPDRPQIAAGMVRTGVVRFVAGLTVTLFPAVLSPKPWVVGLVIFAIGVVLAITPIAYGIIKHAPINPMLMVIGKLVVYAVGAGLGLYLIRRLGPATRVTPV